MPATQRQPTQPIHQYEQCYACQRDQQKRREHARNVELETRLQNLVRQPRASASGASDKLGDHGADQRQAAGDSQTAKK